MISRENPGDDDVVVVVGGVVGGVVVVGVWVVKTKILTVHLPKVSSAKTYKICRLSPVGSIAV